MLQLEFDSCRQAPEEARARLSRRCVWQRDPEPEEFGESHRSVSYLLLSIVQLGFNSHRELHAGLVVAREVAGELRLCLIWKCQIQSHSCPGGHRTGIKVGDIEFVSDHSVVRDDE